jgi:hypothetical protein
VAVTKAVRAEVATALCEAGTADLGENRLPSLEQKAQELQRRGLAPRWHFLGHLQRNKARAVLRLAHEIHSVDSLRLLETLERLADEEDRRPGLYLQVQVVPEENKGGLAPEEVEAVAEHAARRGALPLLGLMAMAPLVLPEQQRAEARATFETLRALADRLPGGLFEGGAPRLSMGMSGDFELAILEGAHDVRVGTRLFEGLDAQAVRGAARGGAPR